MDVSQSIIEYCKLKSNFGFTFLEINHRSADTIGGL